MKTKLSIVLLTIISLLGNLVDLNAQNSSEKPKFNIEQDLLLLNYDCKTDVDDLHSIAGFATLLSNSEFSNINYHAVAGTYGKQKGLYVPPNDLFQLAFGNRWTDAHNNIPNAVEKVKPIVISILKEQGNLWVAEAGQSDFTAELVKAIQMAMPGLDIKKRIHVVQHSDWNEKVTTQEKLQFVKEITHYHKIPDGNAVGNGTPGLRSPKFINCKEKIDNPELQKIWELAIELGNKYNGKDGRYLNEAISAGGLDFSDLVEVCWILRIHDIKDVDHFFNLYAN